MSPSAHSPEALLRRIEWTVLRKLDGLLYGDYRTLFRGFGLDLADLREYQLHDEVRHIDWNVTARLQTPYVREYNEDREVTAWFLLDVSPSVDFGSVDVKKRAVLSEFVALLARLLTRSGNRVGAMFYSGELSSGSRVSDTSSLPSAEARSSTQTRDGKLPRSARQSLRPQVDATLPPRTGRMQVLHILNRLMAQPELPQARATDLKAFLEAAAHAIKRRSLVFVVSDFISAPGWDEALQRLSHRHEVLCVRLFDPLEMKLPDLGLIFMQDAETGEQMFVDTHDRGFRDRFAEAAAERELELRSAMSRAGVDVLELSTEDELVDAVLRFADLRKNRSQIAARGALPAHMAVGVPR